jgi:hypothetical protein
MPAAAQQEMEPYMVLAQSNERGYGGLINTGAEAAAAHCATADPPDETKNTNIAVPTTMPTCSASAFELACYLIVRSETFYTKTFFACLYVTTLCVILLPLFVTNTASYGAADKVCHDWTVARANVTRFDVDSQLYDPEWDMDDFADWHLFPGHIFNSTSIGVSLFGFWVWLFFSPHSQKQDLDRTCMENPIAFSKKIHARPSLTCLRLIFSCSGQFFCPSVAGELSRWCLSVRGELHAISHNECGSCVPQHCRGVWPTNHRNEPSVPSLSR